MRLLAGLMLAFFVLTTVPANAESDVSASYATIRQSIAFVIVGKNHRPLQMGTAFCVYSDGRHSVFLTNRHVIQGGDEIAVLIQGASPYYGHARIMRVGTGVDAALIDVPHGGVPALAFSTSLPEEGTRVAVAGYPRTQILFGQVGLGLTPSVHAGTVNALPAGGTLIQFDAQVEPGNSGGPLYDVEKGLVYGIVTWKLNGRESNFAIPLASIQRLASNSGVRLNVQAPVIAQSATPTPEPTAAWDVSACQSAQSDMLSAYADWSGSYDRYAAATQKTASAASGATTRLGASMVSMWIGYELKAIRSVIRDEEPKVARAQQEMDSSGAPVGRLTTQMFTAIRTQDEYAEQWSLSRQRAANAAANGQTGVTVDQDAFQRVRDQQELETKILDELKYAKCTL